MRNPIDSQAAIDAAIDVAFDMYPDDEYFREQFVKSIEALPPAQTERIQNNAVHLCDSCQYTYATCPSHGKDAVFGDGKGNDNICACNKYRPISAQTEACEYYALCRHGRDENKLRARFVPCKYCNANSDGYVKPIEKNNHAFIRFGMDGWKLNLKANGWHGSAKIRYCPMCGRDLLVK